MEDFCCQANTQTKKTLSRGNQFETSASLLKDASTQIGDWKGSYGRSHPELNDKMNYKKLLREVLYDKDVAIEWLRSKDLLARNRMCPNCGEEMHTTKCSDRSDGLKWYCKGKGAKKHQKKSR